MLAEMPVALIAPLLSTSWSLMFGFILFISGVGNSVWHPVRWVQLGTTVFLFYAFIQAKTGDGFHGLDIGWLWTLLSIFLAYRFTLFFWGKAKNVDDLELTSRMEQLEKQRKWAEELRGKSAND